MGELAERLCHRFYERALLRALENRDPDFMSGHREENFDKTRMRGEWAERLCTGLLNLRD